MKNKKNINIITFLIVLLVSFFSSCKKEKVQIGILNGPSSMPVAYLMEKKYEQSANYIFTTFSTPQTLLPKMLKGEVDIGFFPPNVAAKAFNNTKGEIICAGISETGCLFLLANGKEKLELQNLIGQTINSVGFGSTPEYLFQWLLKQNNIPINTPEGISIDYFVTQGQDLAAQLLSRKIDYALVPEPFATVIKQKAKKGIRVLDIQAEYAKVMQDKNATYPITVIVVRKDFAQKKPNEVKAFLKSLEKSINWTNANTTSAGILIEKHIMGLSKETATNAIPTCNFTFKDAQNAKPEIEKHLQLFMEFAPESIGGKLPSDDFYFK